MDHTEAIVELKNIVNNNFINKMIKLIDHKSVNKLTINQNVKDENIRNVNGYHLNFNTPTNLFYWNYVKREIQRLYGFYKIKFPKMKSENLNQIDLLKYSAGGKYEIHTDAYSWSPRSLSIIINLNDEYKGGDLIFTDQKEKEIKRFKLSAGSIVFFPSNFMYPHSIQPITKGTRYSIVAWLQ